MGRRLTQDEVIQQFREAHGDFYDYSKFEYCGNHKKGVIICPKHGEFLQTPSNHKKGHGCPRCAKNHTLSQDEAIQQFREVHGNDYDYSKFVYGGTDVKGIIVCPHHGEFLQSHHHHKSGRGCPQCKSERSSQNQTTPQDEAIQQFREVHGNDYDYSKFAYGGSFKKGVIICPKHGEFLQTPSNHKKGHGCPRCAYEATSKRSKGGYDSLTPEQRTKIKDVYLYHLELQYDGIIFHKVGITGDPPKRFNAIKWGSKSTIINGWIYMYRNAEIAFQREQKILDHMMFDRSERYYHPIKFRGENECFLPVPNPQGWNLDLNNIPKRSKRFKYNEVEDV